jgi:hypothetical protein
VMRELGLSTIFWDVNIGNVGKVFDNDGRLLDAAFVRRSDKFIQELIWMSKVLRYGREQVTVEEEAAGGASAVVCEACGSDMTHHADKLLANDAGETLIAMHQCPGCGNARAKSGFAIRDPNRESTYPHSTNDCSERTA